MDRSTARTRTVEGSAQPPPCERATSRSLAEVIAEIKAEVQKAGLRDEEIDAELAAYNAERRNLD